MEENNTVTRWQQRLLNIKFFAALAFIAIVIGGIAKFADDVGKLVSLFKPKPPQLSGTLSIANEFCPFVEYSEDLLRPKGTEGLTFFRSPDEFLVIWPRIHMEALSPSPPEASLAEFTPFWVRAQETRLTPNPNIGSRSFRLLIYGSAVINRLWKSYELRSDKASHFDEVFRPLPEGRVANYYHTLGFLARLYPPLDAPPEQKELAINLIQLNRELLPTKAELTEMAPELNELFAFYQHLLLRQTDPVFRLTLINHGDDPVVITSLVCQLKKVFPAKDTYESGPLEVLGSVTFMLPSQPSTIEQTLPKGPVKLAPRDAGSFIIRLKGHGKAAYQLSFSVKREGDVVYETEDLLVGILGG